MLRAVRSHLRELTFVLKVLPMLPSGVVDPFTRPTHVERLRYRGRNGDLEAEVFVPGGRGPHPGMVLCLGVVPIGMGDPRIPPIFHAWARAGFVAVAFWSDAMRDRRLDPGDVVDVARAYDALLQRHDVDPMRSGLLGTCVGGSFAFLAAAHPLIRDRVRFVSAFAPYSSLWTFVRDIVSASRDGVRGREPWAVDQLTRAVLERTLHALLSDDAADEVLSARDPATADAALRALPDEARAVIDAMSPVQHLDGIRAPAIVFGHDRDDNVIPAAESRRLAAALAGRAGVRYTEYAMFQHADPLGRRLPPLRLIKELARFYGSLQPLFRATT